MLVAHAYFVVPGRQQKSVDHEGAPTPTVDELLSDMDMGRYTIDYRHRVVRCVSCPHTIPIAGKNANGRQSTLTAVELMAEHTEKHVAASSAQKRAAPGVPATSRQSKLITPAVATTGATGDMRQYFTRVESSKAFAADYDTVLCEGIPVETVHVEDHWHDQVEDGIAGSAESEPGRVLVNTALLFESPLIQVDGEVPYRAYPSGELLSLPNFETKTPAVYSKHPVLRANECSMMRPTDKVRSPFAEPYQASCSHCRGLLASGTDPARRLQRSLLRRHKRVTDAQAQGSGSISSTKTNYQYMTAPEFIPVVRRKDAQNAELRLDNHTLKKRADRLHQRLETQTQIAERLFRHGDFGAALQRLFRSTARGKSDLDSIPPAAANMLNRACKLAGKKSNIKISEEVLMMADLMKQRWGTSCMMTYLVNHGGGSASVVARYVERSLEVAPRFLPTTIPTMFDPTAPIDELVYIRWMSFRRMYAGFMALAGLTFGTVLMKLAEDETMIMERPVYVPDGKADVVWGYCGRKGHTCCDPGVSHKVGHSLDATAHNGLVEFMATHHLARYLRAFVAVPQVPAELLPPMVVGYYLTCLRFTHVRVIQDWDYLTHLCDVFLLDIVGPVVDYASDGASSRTAAQSRLSLKPLNTKWTSFAEGKGLPFKHDGLRFPGGADEDTTIAPKALRYTGAWRQPSVQQAGDAAARLLLEGGSFGPSSATTWKYDPDRIRQTLRKKRGIPALYADQDWRHNLKKLLNVLDSLVRNIRFGPFLIHLVHLHEIKQALADLGGTDKLDLDYKQWPQWTGQDLDRSDRMNTHACFTLTDPSVWKYTIPAVAAARKMTHVDQVPGGAYEGTRVYLEMMHYYKSIFVSKTISIAERMERAYYCIYFLGIWRDWLLQRCDHRGKHQFTLTENFITRQAYQDVEMSCNDVILFCQVTRFWLSRHGNEGFGVYLERHGSDALEELFGRLATWDGSRRVCNALDIMRLITSMMRRYYYGSRGGDGVPKIPRYSVNSDIWRNKTLPEEEDGEPYDPKDIPSWAAQTDIAQQALVRVHAVFERCGMAPIKTPASATKAEQAEHAWYFDPNYRDESYERLEKIMAKLEKADLAEQQQHPGTVPGGNAQWTAGHGGGVERVDSVVVTIVGAGAAGVNGDYEQDNGNPLAYHRKDDKANATLDDSKVHTLHRADGKWVIGLDCQLLRAMYVANPVDGEALPPASGWSCKRAGKAPAPSVTLPEPEEDDDDTDADADADSDTDADADADADTGTDGEGVDHDTFSLSLLKPVPGPNGSTVLVKVGKEKVVADIFKQQLAALVAAVEADRKQRIGQGGHGKVKFPVTRAYAEAVHGATIIRQVRGTPPPCSTRQMPRAGAPVS